MPERKKHHFVPKLLLRHFATDSDKKIVNVFNADTGFYRPDIPLKSQLQEDYFYGEDGLIEDALGKLESAAAPVIAEIISKRELPKRFSGKYTDLFIFSFLLPYRTKNAADQTNEIADKLFQDLLQTDEGAKFRDKGYRIGVKNGAVQSLQSMAKAIFGAYDLEMALLINNSRTKFITSDNPSIRYNQFLEQRNHPGGHLSIHAKGLQLFFPLTPELMIIYYDKWAYKIGNKKDIIISLTNTNDVDQLNYLQVVNCSKLIFSNNLISSFYLSNLSAKAAKNRLKRLIKSSEINAKINGVIIKNIHHPDERRIKLDLSFIKQPKRAKSHTLNNFLVQLRHENVRSANHGDVQHLTIEQ